jgi:hypothetical protein
MSNAVYIYCQAQELDKAEAVLGDLAGMQEAHSTIPGIHTVRAMALAMYLAVAGNLRRLDAMQNRLNELAALAMSPPRSASVARWLAEGLENSIIATVSAAGGTVGQQTAIVGGYLDQLRQLHQEYGDNDLITEHLAAGIAWAVGGHANIQSSDFQLLLDEIRTLYQKQPQRWLASQLALALFHGMLGFINLQQSDHIDPLRSEVIELARIFPGLTQGRPKTIPHPRDGL